MTARRLLASLAVLTLVPGCASDGGGPQSVDPPTPKTGVSASTRPPGQFSKEGWFGTADGLHARLDIKGIERQGAKTVLRYTVTSMDNVTKSVPFTLLLLDPLGRKVYRPVTGNPSPPGTEGAPGLGAPPANVQFAPKVARDLTADFPPVPAEVRQLTVISSGTAGEFTGIPVSGRGDAPSSATPSTAATPSAAPVANPSDLYDITEGQIKDVTSGGLDVQVNLHADVLFTSGSAKLSGRAKGILDQTAQDIRVQGEPSRGAVTINGHTGSEGSDADNLKLSKEQAEAVQKELQNRLGATYRYSAQGKGEAELVAKEGGSDDAQARARNRRVEISYPVRQQAAAATPSGRTAAPAAFRAQDGNTVASRSARFGQDKRRLDVKPFYRDGAYLVAVFEIVNEGPGTIPPDAVYPHKDYLGGSFTSFSVLVQGGTDVYRAVRMGKPAANSATYVDPGRATFRTAVNEPIRGFVYIPAPPGNPRTVVLDAGVFGKVNNVPVS